MRHAAVLGGAQNDDLGPRVRRLRAQRDRRGSGHEKRQRDRGERAREPHRSAHSTASRRLATGRRVYSPPVSGPDLQELREELEGLDRRILELVRARMEVVERVAAAKLEAASPLRDRLREEHVLQRVRHAAAELGLDPHEIERLYRQLIEMSVARQQGFIASLDSAPLRVAYQGVEGSNSHLAAQRRYGGRRGGVLLTGHETFREAVAALQEGAADLALLPIENSTAGSINDTYDLLAEGGITITAEVVSAVEHCLLGLPGARVEDLRQVLSHPQALLQCAGFLRGAPWIEPRAEFDTAGAARKVREANDPRLAAIASAEAAALHGLEILRRGIQTEAVNYTRFVEVALHPIPCPPGAAVQDVAPARPRPPPRRARRSARRAGAARHQPHQARVASDRRLALALPLLPRSRGPRGFRADRAGARHDPPAHLRAARARHLSASRRESGKRSLGTALAAILLAIYGSREPSSLDHRRPDHAHASETSPDSSFSSPRGCPAGARRRRGRRYRFRHPRRRIHRRRRALHRGGDPLPDHSRLVVQPEPRVRAGRRRQSA